MDPETKLDIQKIIVDLFSDRTWKLRFKEYLETKQIKNIEDVNEWALNLKYIDKKRFYHILKIKNNPEELQKFKIFIEAIENE